MLGWVGSVLSFVVGVSLVESLVTQQRWCEVTVGEWTAYNDSTTACVHCASLTKLVSIKPSTNDLECCSGLFQSQCSLSCQTANQLTCRNGRKYCPEETCNEYNNCGDGTDEFNIPGQTCQATCHNGSFSCAEADVQCFAFNKVCDGSKDCFSGTDEINCVFYGGRCRGFLCTMFPQCVLASEVCDGKKDCLDGSDEQSCSQYCTGQQFDCSATTKNIKNCPGKSISISEVCNGNPECPSGIDENNCYTWSQWSSWSSPCQCSGLLAQSGTRGRSRLCMKLHRTTVDHPGQCGSGMTSETSTCSCTPTFDSTTLIVVISLVALIVIVGIIVIVCLMRSRRRKRRRQLSERLQQTLQTPMYTVSGPPSAPALPPDRSPAAISQYSRQTHLATPAMHTPQPSLHGSPYLHDRYERFTSAGYAHNDRVDRSPAPSHFSRKSGFATSSSLLDVSADDISRSSRSPRRFPLPARPSSPDELGYQRIKGFATDLIDPYAETRRFQRPVSPASRSVRSGYSLRRSDSLESVVNVREGSFARSDGGRYSPEARHRDRTISRFPYEELGHAPRAPRFRRTQSTEAMDTDGYLLPTTKSYLPNQRPSRSNRSSPYTSMSSPEKNKAFRTTLSGPVSKKGYAKVVKKNGKRMESVIQRQQRVERAKSYHGATSAAALDGRVSPSRSETYAIMRRDVQSESLRFQFPSSRSSGSTTNRAASGANPYPESESSANRKDTPLSPPQFAPPTLQQKLRAGAVSSSHGKAGSPAGSDTAVQYTQLVSAAPEMSGKFPDDDTRRRASSGESAGHVSGSSFTDGQLEYDSLFKPIRAAGAKQAHDPATDYDNLRREISVEEKLSPSEK